MDLLEIDAASNRGIDAIRDLRERINYAPTDLKRKVYILDEAHQITRDAWNALLKSLEEPPPFVVFMFASTHPQEFPPAILSRLQRFDVRRLTTDEIEGKLRRILEGDGRTATPEAIHLIARLAAGGMRDAESMLDQLLSSSADELDEAHVRDLLGLADTETVAGFVDALVATDARAGMRLLDGLEERGRDLRGFLDQVIETLRAGIIGAAPTAEPGAGAVGALRGRARRGGAPARRDRSEPRRRGRPPPPARARAVPGPVHRDPARPGGRGLGAGTCRRGQARCRAIEAGRRATAADDRARRGGRAAKPPPTAPKPRPPAPAPTSRPQSPTSKQPRRPIRRRRRAAAAAAAGTRRCPARRRRRAAQSPPTSPCCASAGRRSSPGSAPTRRRSRSSSCAGRSASRTASSPSASRRTRRSSARSRSAARPVLEDNISAVLGRPVARPLRGNQRRRPAGPAVGRGGGLDPRRRRSASSATTRPMPPRSADGRSCSAAPPSRRLNRT